ncbi:bifunctional isocitrate dehydrogenase kinase/phosphatase [Kallotenue papyrolyticum]|uniref:bifunctional isocitrate dehydrogenase kinase/phosphatase n=1 Tax=Kallotenue papyrolyticum TaxID=1325125 RepID=UPI0005BC6435|nr:bifunctional isocitrate dehydrogenase kinase/phosphatase [Kallotenue papyrolyticum]
MPSMDEELLARQAATAIAAAYEAYQADFRAITRRARGRFERCDWHGLQDDAVARLDSYRAHLDRLLVVLRRLLATRFTDRALWQSLRAHYAALIAARPDSELAETFFNSLTRRVFATVGVDAALEFVRVAAPSPVLPADTTVARRYHATAPDAPLMLRLLADVPWSVPYADLPGDAQRVAAAVTAAVQTRWGDLAISAVELLRPVFFRNKGAYLIGRVCRGAECLPLVLPLLHDAAGIQVDAVLLSEDEASIVFSFTRSYFHVDVDRPRELVAFLRTIMPRKPIAELYTALGYHKHGKTEFYADLLRHLHAGDDCFEIARGERGMVMIVFTMPSYDVVFKVIRDRFAEPKTTTRQQVMARYQLVFHHDRAGRLVDAQEFEHLTFDRRRFHPALLEELLTGAAQSVHLIGEQVHIRHLYTERRVTPLNLFVQEADEQAARRVVIDYGRCLKDLAAANIFPGDILLKNFGVTRHGRVVFYDYDELCLLTDCRFRELPLPRDDEEALAGEPWFAVGEGDVFPAELQLFLGLREPYRSLFHAHHADLFTVDFWQTMQQRCAAGELPDIFPYDECRRLRQP